MVVWVNEHLGSPDEAQLLRVADLWNTIEPDVKMKMCVLGHAGYESKLRVAIASGQPPDVCFSGIQTLEALQFSGKASDLSVPIPVQYFPEDDFARMSPVIRKSLAPTHPAGPHFPDLAIRLRRVSAGQ